MSYRPRKNKIEINIEGDKFMPAVKASSGTPLPYHSLKEICGRIVFTHWTSETEGILYMLDKEEIAFKDVGNCQTIPGSTGEYAPDRSGEDEISNALFNAYDIRRTLESYSLMNIKRVHGGTENEETLKDLISDVILFLEKLEER